MRTTYDLEMLRQIGYCSGIENYSMHIDGRVPGSPPNTLLDYFPEDFLLVIDESHVTVPQIGAMYEGDASRKRTLVEHGFRLPSALDNRPLKWEEFQERIGQAVYLSATPGQYELSPRRTASSSRSSAPPAWSTPRSSSSPPRARSTTWCTRSATRVEKDERVLVTTLTKKMAEDLTDYFLELGIQVRYLHSDVDTLRRVELLRELRSGEYDVLVGINLLREGLDLPEVSLVAILDADKEGFLRSGTSLIQTIGRAARNVSGQVHMYADKITPAMERAIDETNRRREKQVAYNTSERHRPAAAPQEDQRHRRPDRPRGHRHRAAARLRLPQAKKDGGAARRRCPRCGKAAKGRRPAPRAPSRCPPTVPPPNSPGRSRS